MGEQGVIGLSIAGVLGQELAGGMSALTVAQQVLGSQEASSGAVQGVYQQLLHRPADAAGLQAFVGQLQNRDQRWSLAS